MLRFLLLLLGLIVAGVYLWRGLLRLAGRGSGQRLPAKERVVRCAHCGLYVPEGEALVLGPHHFCSEEHRLEGPRGGSA